MNKISPEETEKRKKAIFESMSPRRQKFILNKVGFDKWDPFEEPKDPIDIRRDQTKRTTKTLVRDFLHTRTMDSYSNAYGQAVLDICLGIMNDDERYKAMYDFSCWYRDLLEKDLGKTEL